MLIKEEVANKMEEGDDDMNGFEEEEYDEEGQIKKPGKKKKELSDFEKMKIRQTIEEMKKNQIQHQKINQYLEEYHPRHLHFHKHNHFWYKK